MSRKAAGIAAAGSATGNDDATDGGTVGIDTVDSATVDGGTVGIDTMNRSVVVDDDTVCGGAAYSAARGRRRHKKSLRFFIANDGGFTTVGVAVALLLSLALLFTAVQVRWIQSQSADIQFVADAGALAGAKVVGEYLVVARIADAVVLSLSLLGMTVYGVAIVVSCIPFLQTAGAELMQFGTKVFQARDRCATTAAKALNSLQAALPFLIAVNAAATIEANANISEAGAAYHGLAIPLPLNGEEAAFQDDAPAQESVDELTERNEQTAEHTDASERAYKEMQAAKERAYLADCGNRPNYCMYERANTLAGLSGGQNPSFSSVDTWLFDYAYQRAEAYYARRLAREAPANQSLDESIRSSCRTRLYAYMVEELENGWCETLPNGTLDAHFPRVPRNTSDVRETRLYTEAVYPLSADGVLHGSVACSAYQTQGAAGLGSLASLEEGAHASCDTCGFVASTLGRVAAASSTIDNGFEYHYEIVAEEAERYQSASEEYGREADAAMESAEASFEIFEEALQALKVPRIKPKPPGHNGVIALVWDSQSHGIPGAFSNPLVGGNVHLQARLALSAAALAEEPAAEGANVIASFLDQLRAEAGQSSFAPEALGAFDGILELWGSALMVYSQGGDAISQGLGDFLDAIPVVRATPLSRWARSTLSNTVEALGLEGANLDTPKPVLVNTLHVAQASDAAPARALSSARQWYMSLRGPASGSFQNLFVEEFSSALTQQTSEFLEQEFTLFEISFGDAPAMPRIPITLRLPDSVVQRGRELGSELASSVSAWGGGGGAGEVWD